MSNYPYYEVNAFSEAGFSGNPAGICLLDRWKSDQLLQAIAAQNNLAETAFVVQEGDFHTIRWFTPKAEIDLCGHATLGAAHILMTHDWPKEKTLTFQYAKGRLVIQRSSYGYEMIFPSMPCQPYTDLVQLKKLLEIDIAEAWIARDLVVVLSSEEEVKAFHPDLTKLQSLPGLGFAVTSVSREYDFVSRCFFPKIGIPEDPVTGATHCTLAPLWAAKLGKHKMHAQQASNRGGDLFCEIHGDSVLLVGKANTYLKGTISVED